MQNEEIEGVGATFVETRSFWKQDWL